LVDKDLEIWRGGQLDTQTPQVVSHRMAWDKTTDNPKKRSCAIVVKWSVGAWQGDREEKPELSPLKLIPRPEGWIPCHSGRRRGDRSGDKEGTSSPWGPVLQAVGSQVSLRTEGGQEK
jgi:hypothetical protein